MEDDIPKLFKPHNIGPILKYFGTYSKNKPVVEILSPLILPAYE